MRDKKYIVTIILSGLSSIYLAFLYMESMVYEDKVVWMDFPRYRVEQVLVSSQVEYLVVSSICAVIFIGVVLLYGILRIERSNQEEHDKLMRENEEYYQKMQKIKKVKQ
jgi:hypothetical protein